MKKFLTCLTLAISVMMAHAQVAPSVPASSQITGVSGNGHALATTTGSVTSGHCGQFDANGNLVDSGSACGTGSGATTPATGNLLKGNGSANGVVAATAGSDYVAPAPSGSQTIAQPSGTSLNITSENGRLHAEGFPSGGCTTVSGGVTTSQGGCAFYSAVDLATNTGNSVDLILGDDNNIGGLQTCEAWVEPNAFYQVNIIGTSINGSAVIGTCSHPTLPMLTRTAGAASLVMRDVTWQTNSNFGSCFDYPGEVYNGHIDNVTCYGTIPTTTSGLDHLIQLGSSSNYMQNMVIHNLNIGGVFGHPSSYASLTAGGTTSLASITINNGGGGYTAGSTQGIVNDPHHFCSVEPAFTVTLTSGAVTGYSITTAGTCSGGLPDLAVNSSFQVTYGLKAYLSDSMLDYFTPDTAGIAGGIFFGGNTTINHAHPTNIATGLIINAPVSLVNTECDTIVSDCIQFQGTWGSNVIGTGAFIADTHFPGSAVYQFASSAANVIFGPQQNLCGGATPVDYQEFVGSSGILTPGGSGWPNATNVFGNDKTCTSLSSGQNIDYAASMTIPALTSSTISGVGGFGSLSGFWEVDGEFVTGSGTDAVFQGNTKLNKLGNASGGTNFNSNTFRFTGSYGSNADDNWDCNVTVASGTGNPETDFKCQHAGGSTGSHYFDVSSLTGAKAAHFLVGGSEATVATTPTAGQAACILSAGPPVVIGYCSSVVSSGGACTCN